MMPTKDDQLDYLNNNSNNTNDRNNHNNNNNNNNNLSVNNINMDYDKNASVQPTPQLGLGDSNNNSNNNVNNNNNNNNNNNVNNNNNNNSTNSNNNGNNSNITKSFPGTVGLSKAELRKSNKPIMEKKRRARINNCLNELKSLILEAMKKDPARHTKLEKADILEMTVKHLQSIQRSQLADPLIMHKFKAGFADCTDVVNRYVNQMDDIELSVKQRLIGYLNNCVSDLKHVTPPPPPAYNTTTLYNNNYNRNISPFLSSTAAIQTTMQSAKINQLSIPQVLGEPMILTINQHDINNNNNNNNNNNCNNNSNGNNNNNNSLQMTDVHFIPSRLPSGELALVMPNSSNLKYFPTRQQHQQQLSTILGPTLTTAITTTSTTSTTSKTTIPRIKYSNVNVNCSKKNNSFLEISTAYPRFSAFNSVAAKKQQVSLLSNSPPLSPSSSLSSCGDEFGGQSVSIVQPIPLTLTDRQNQHNLPGDRLIKPSFEKDAANIFPITTLRDNNGNDINITNNINYNYLNNNDNCNSSLQQHQISSTTEPIRIQPLLVINNMSNLTNNLTTSGKMETSTIDNDAPQMKRIKLEDSHRLADHRHSHAMDMSLEELNIPKFNQTDIINDTHNLTRTESHYAIPLNTINDVDNSKDNADDDVNNNNVNDNNINHNSADNMWRPW